MPETMDDLADLDWSTASQSSDKRPAFNNTTNYYPALKATPPVSGRSTPLPDNRSKVQAPTLQSDSFASLLPSFATNQSTKNLSLKDQQALLEEQKRQKTLNQARQWDSLGGGSSSGSIPKNISGTTSTSPAFTQSLGIQTNGRTLPLRSTTPLQQNGSDVKPTRQASETTNTILAAFNSTASAGKPSQLSGLNLASSAAVNLSSTKSSTQQSNNILAVDDDDPFGLGTTPTYSNAPPTTISANAAEEDDVLGLLGKSVSELAQSKASDPGSSAHPVDAAIAELVDMGFTAEKAQEALSRTESGLDVQSAVGYLLNQAHSESRSKSRGSASESPAPDERRRRPDDDPLENHPNRQQRAGSQQRPENGQTGFKETSKIAAELGNNFLKTAGSFWKASQKKVTKAMAEFNAEAESSQPKWMRDAAAQRPSNHAREAELSPNDSMQRAPKSPMNAVTDEAALLEMGTGRPQPTRKKKTEPEPDSYHNDRLNEPFERQKVESKPSQPVKQALSNERRPIEAQNVQRPIRQVEEDFAAYISPARRKKNTAPQQQPQVSQSIPKYNNEASIGSPQGSRGSVTTTSVMQPAPARPATMIPVSNKPKPPPRVIPTIPISVVQASTRHRNAGTAAFKLGNYAEAHTSYTAAFRDIPKQHPLLIILLTNRALTSLKTGDPKQCIADADQALEIIGPSQGKGESFFIEGEEGKKDMEPYWGKAMMRRAEALEQLERWADAAKVWRECVEAGVGGAQSVQGRTRCEKASGNHQTSTPVPRRTTSAPPRATPKATPKPATRSALDDLSGRPAASTAASSEAVERLRAANSAAAKLDDERFALTDAVADRVEKWKKGKEQNLRALLGSLDTVLWADSGWKKVGMGELLNPSKVKINYMKGIAKVHPDKLPTSASTEQIMISGAVFSTLNEAWDAFKKENGL